MSTRKAIEDVGSGVEGMAEGSEGARRMESKTVRRR